MLIFLIFISLICISIYEMINLGNSLLIEYDSSLISALTIIGCAGSVIIGIMCQIFLSKVEGAQNEWNYNYFDIRYYFKYHWICCLYCIFDTSQKVYWISKKLSEFEENKQRIKKIINNDRKDFNHGA